MLQSPRICSQASEAYYEGLIVCFLPLLFAVGNQKLVILAVVFGSCSEDGSFLIELYSVSIYKI